MVESSGWFTRALIALRLTAGTLAAAEIGVKPARLPAKPRFPAGNGVGVGALGCSGDACGLAARAIDGEKPDRPAIPALSRSARASMSEERCRAMTISF